LAEIKKKEKRKKKKITAFYPGRLTCSLDPLALAVNLYPCSLFQALCAKLCALRCFPHTFKKSAGTIDFIDAPR